MASKTFVHVVNFWLKPDLSRAQIETFERGLMSLKAIESLMFFNVGTPAATNRPVIDRSYSYCLLTVFADEKGHDIYQNHPVHLAFVDTCKSMWDKVLIYDSENIA